LEAPAPVDNVLDDTPPHISQLSALATLKHPHLNIHSPENILNVLHKKLHQHFATGQCPCVSALASQTESRRLSLEELMLSILEMAVEIFVRTSFICKVIFFPPNFSFVFWNKEFWREKNLLYKEGYSGVQGKNNAYHNVNMNEF
jgi:hypothetical protein